MSRDARTLSIAEVESAIISAIEETPCDQDNSMGEQSLLWEKVYGALRKLSLKAKERSDEA